MKLDQKIKLDNFPSGIKRILKRSIKTSHMLLESAESLHKFNHFCFIWRKNKLVAIGKNKPIATDRMALYFGERYNVEKFKNYPFLHAEIDAISKCWGKNHLDNSYSMIVIRMNKDGSFKNSKPCIHCQPIINAIGIEKIYWSTENNTIETTI